MFKRIIIAVLLAWLYGCTGTETAGPDGDPYVLLVYIAADNDLWVEAEQKLEALRQGFDPKAGARVLVYMDACQAAPRLVELTAAGGEARAETIAEYPEQNSASAEVLAGVIERVRDMGPASGYGLLVFSHASGWLPQGALSDPAGVTRTVGRDGTDEMELADFAAAIPDGMFDYIVFEACFMAGIEVMDALCGKADYILASAAEIVSPGFTDIYPEHLPRLLRGPEGLLPFARAAFDHYDAQSGWMRSATFSVVRTAGIPALVEFLRSEIEFDPGLDLSGVQPFDRYSSHLFWDLAACCARALGDDAARCAELEALIAECVAWQAATPSFLPGYAGFTIDTHCGLTLYWPQPAFSGLNAIWRETMGLD
ncbi:MAG: clostripain-related cysteine peptidase [Rikenellaceae bacterium]|nr:clostripain-related cysteine peptidase [Rikenellaceae bacterium]